MARAARLYGISLALRETIGVSLTPTQLADMQPHLEAARRRLGESAFEAARPTGRALSLEQAIAYALESTGRG